MNKILASFAFLIISLFAINVQAQDPVIASAKAVVVNDSTYTIKANLQIKEGWHVYGDNPDGLNAPTFTAGIETAQFKAAASFITKSIKQKDVLFVHRLVCKVNRHYRLTNEDMIENY